MPKTLSGASEVESLARAIFIAMTADPSKMRGFEDATFALRSFRLAEAWLDARDQWKSSTQDNPERS